MAKNSLLSAWPCMKQLRIDFLRMVVRTAQVLSPMNSYVSRGLQSHGNSTVVMSVSFEVRHTRVQIWLF